MAKKFVFRLEPMARIAGRQLVEIRNLIKNVEKQQKMILETQDKRSEMLKEQELMISQVADGREAILLFQRRSALQNKLKNLVQEYRDLEQEKLAHNQELNITKREIHRLELVREKALKEFVNELRAEEAKELDEIAILRYKGPRNNNSMNR